MNTQSPLPNFVFFGTPTVASGSLELLAAQSIVPSIIITNPDAPKGRGHHLSPSPVKEWALAHGIPVLTPEKLDAETIATITKEAMPFALVIAYGKIFPEELIQAFPLGVINVHYSLLPKYRGATPLESALLHDEPHIGVTLQRMVKELDAGDVLAQESILVRTFETALGVRPKLIQLGVQLLTKNLPAFVAGTAVFSPQDHALATKTKKLHKDDGQLNLSDSDEMNWIKYRSYNDTIGTFFIADNKRVKVTDADWIDDSFFIRSVVPEGKREMSYAEYGKLRKN